MTTPGRALHTANVQTAFDCARCGSILDKRTSVSFTLTIGSTARPAVMCGTCFDALTSELPASATLSDVLDGAVLWARKPRVRA